MNIYLLLQVLRFAGCYIDGKSSRPYSVAPESRTAADNLLAFGLGPKCAPFKADHRMQPLGFVKCIGKIY